MLTSLKEATILLDNNFMDTLLPTKEEIQILEKINSDFRIGLEYEFRIHKDYISEDNKWESSDGIGVKTQLRLSETFDNIKLSENKKIKKTRVTTDDFNEDFLVEHNFEIITKTFNSISEMLIFNNLILQTVENKRIKSYEDVLIVEKDIKEYEEEHNIKIDRDKLKKDSHEKFPGSIHFNISLPNIKKINKAKFLLALNETGVMDKWEVGRNEYIKDLKTMMDIFGPNVFESKEIDKKWSINFEHLHSNEGEEYERIEIRFIGSSDYSSPEKIKEINNTFYHILQSAEIGMDIEICTKAEILKQKEVYNDYINRSISNSSEELEREEKEFLIDTFDLKDEKELEVKFQLIKNEIKDKIELNKQNIGKGM